MKSEKRPPADDERRPPFEADGHRGESMSAHQRAAPLPLVGIDFTSNPSRRKPITLARGSRLGDVVRLDGLDEHASFVSYEAWLRSPGPWLGAFDFPFGLPRAFVDANALGDSAAAVLRAVHAGSGGRRMGFRRLIDEWGNTQPAGYRLLHRRCDTAMAGVRSTSPLQTRYVPVGLMYFEGLSRLLDAGVCIAGLHAGDGEGHHERDGDVDGARLSGHANAAANASGSGSGSGRALAARSPRIAVEGYPGLLAHELIGRRSYKNRDAPDRLIARKEIVDALEQGRPARLGLRLQVSHAKRDALIADASGDRLDAVLCLVQAAWSAVQPGFGLPPAMDRVEGWIATTPWPACAPPGRPEAPVPAWQEQPTADEWNR